MAARKSLTFLNSILTSKKSADAVVGKKLKPGKFVFTPSGIAKVLGIICLLAAITFFLGSSACDEEAIWRKYLFIVFNAVAIFTTLALYLVFSFGYAVKKPWLWIKTDIILNVLLPIVSIICSTIATFPCRSRNQLHKLPEPLAIAGGVVLIISAAALSLMYRHKVDEPKIQVPKEIATTSSTEEPEARKSVFA